MLLTDRIGRNRVIGHIIRVSVHRGLFCRIELNLTLEQVFTLCRTCVVALIRLVRPVCNRKWFLPIFTVHIFDLQALLDILGQLSVAAPITQYWQSVRNLGVLDSYLLSGHLSQWVVLVLMKRNALKWSINYFVRGEQIWLRMLFLFVCFMLVIRYGFGDIVLFAGSVHLFPLLDGLCEHFFLDKF